MDTAPSTAPLTGHRAMHAWNPTWKPGHLPDWTRRNLRQKMRDCGVKSYSVESWLIDHKFDGLSFSIAGVDYETGPLWILDHWGSIRNNKGHRELVMCPYGRDDHAAEMLAKYLRATSWLVAPQGPWHPQSFLYIFIP